MSDDKIKLLREVRSSLVKFSPACLKIRAKNEQIIPLVLNRTQLETHKLLEQQREEKGWVRALILKGRQPGISTYVAARFYNKASLRTGVNVYILSHEQASADALFGIVDRYQRNNPLAPHVGASNAKELVFDKLDSSYQVATAGQKAGGRGRSISLFHGSEVAFWTNASDHFAASVQAVPLMNNTEVILESTSSGPSGEFYNRWQDAESGRGDYIPIFLPWWWTDEYSRDPELGFELLKDADDGEMSEQEYADVFKVSLRQMAWRRSKIYELRSLALFQREYPALPSEAWVSTGENEPFIKPLYAIRARKAQIQGSGPLVIGVDPASMGGDRFSVAARRGNQVLWVRHRLKIDHNEGTAWIKSLIDELKPARVNIDAGNIGVTIVTNLKTLGPHYANIVRGVNFGATSEFKHAKPKTPGPANRRAEMWARMRDWLMSEEGASIPDDAATGDPLQTDLTAPRLKPKLNHDFLLEAKIDMKKRGVKSPDLADAVALTFAFNEYFANFADAPVVQAYGNPDSHRPTPAMVADAMGSSGWMA